MLVKKSNLSDSECYFKALELFNTEDSLEARVSLLEEYVLENSSEAVELFTKIEELKEIESKELNSVAKWAYSYGDGENMTVPALIVILAQHMTIDKCAISSSVFKYLNTISHKKYKEWVNRVNCGEIEKLNTSTNVYRMSISDLYCIFRVKWSDKKFKDILGSGIYTKPNKRCETYELQLLESNITALHNAHALEEARNSLYLNELAIKKLKESYDKLLKKIECLTSEKDYAVKRALESKASVIYEKDSEIKRLKTEKSSMKKQIEELLIANSEINTLKNSIVSLKSELEYYKLIECVDEEEANIEDEYKFLDVNDIIQVLKGYTVLIAGGSNQWKRNVSTFLNENNIHNRSIDISPSMVTKPIKGNEFMLFSIKSTKHGSWYKLLSDLRWDKSKIAFTNNSEVKLSINSLYRKIISYISI